VFRAILSLIIRGIETVFTASSIIHVELLPTGFMGELELSHENARQQLMCIIPEAVNTVSMLLMMSESIARNT
jgi:hypothetical protein